jgi:hypothetical protein
LTRFVAQRYRMVGGGYELATWSTSVYEYGELAGLKLPTRGQAIWRLAEGDLAYIDFTIAELAYDTAEGTGFAHAARHTLARRSTRLRHGARDPQVHDAAS